MTKDRDLQGIVTSVSVAYGGGGFFIFLGFIALILWILSWFEKLISKILSFLFQLGIVFLIFLCAFLIMKTLVRIFGEIKLWPKLKRFFFVLVFLYYLIPYQEHFTKYCIFSDSASLAIIQGLLYPQTEHSTIKNRMIIRKAIRMLGVMQVKSIKEN